MTVVFTHSQSTWNTGGEHLLRDETVCRGREEAVRWGKGEAVCWGRGEAICQGKELFVEGGGKPLVKGGGKLFVEAGEPIGQGKDDAVVKGGGKPFVEGGWMATVRREREDASAREGGCRLFVERGRMPAIHREREVAIRWEREEAAVRCGGREEEWISALLGNSKFNDVGISNSVDDDPENDLASRGRSQ